MSGSKSYFEEPGDDGGKLAKKAKDSPFMVVGKLLHTIIHYYSCCYVKLY